MPIDFHDARNAHTYATRTADPTWRAAIVPIAPATGKRVVDIGCGGGVYTRAWAEFGAAGVIGVDFSQAMVEAARANCADLPGVTIRRGDALATGLADGCADIVYERALVHHFTDLEACAREAFRLLAPNGLYLAQDRTPDDVQAPATPEHVRGYFHVRFPRLLDIELRRRPTGKRMRAALAAAEFTDVLEQTLWETQRVEPSFEALAADIRRRADRSILHELGDAELEELVAYLRERLPAVGPIADTSRWTLWWGRRPA